MYDDNKNLKRNKSMDYKEINGDCRETWCADFTGRGIRIYKYYE